MAGGVCWNVIVGVPMIKVLNLHKSYGEIKALDGISFEIPRGEIFGLLGPNGAGKSTAINIIVGVLTPDSGQVSVGGMDDPTRPEVRQKIGNAPQSLALYDELTARENLEFFGRMYGLSGKNLAARVDAALEFSVLVDRQKGKVVTFSGGMKRRLNMAAALVHDPPVLLFDEPTVGVDPQSRNMIFDSIEKLKDEGRTIIYTTHYMEEAERLCDRVAIMDHGKILALDRVDNLTREHGGDATIVAELENIPENLADLPGELDGDRLKILTSDPMRDLSKLTAAGVELKQLRIDWPDLEAVFLNLTGRSLRD